MSRQKQVYRMTMLDQVDFLAVVSMPPCLAGKPFAPISNFRAEILILNVCLGGGELTIGVRGRFLGFCFL